MGYLIHILINNFSIPCLFLRNKKITILMNTISVNYKLINNNDSFSPDRYGVPSELPDWYSQTHYHTINKG